MEVTLVPQIDSLQNALERLSHSAREAHDRWVASLQAAGNGAWLRQVEQSYTTNLDVAERMVEQSLELQNSLWRNWRQALEASAAAQPAMSQYASWLNWFDQAQASHAELWQRWFNAARKLELEAARVQTPLAEARPSARPRMAARAAQA